MGDIIVGYRRLDDGDELVVRLPNHPAMPDIAQKLLNNFGWIYRGHDSRPVAWITNGRFAGKARGATLALGNGRTLMPLDISGSYAATTVPEIGLFITFGRNELYARDPRMHRLQRKWEACAWMRNKPLLMSNAKFEAKYVLPTTECMAEAGALLEELNQADSVASDEAMDEGPVEPPRVRRLLCPRCSTEVEAPEGWGPICPHCGHR